MSRSFFKNFSEVFQIFLYVSHNRGIIFILYHHVPLSYIFPVPHEELAVPNLHFPDDSYYLEKVLSFLKEGISINIIIERIQVNLLMRETIFLKYL